MAKIVIVFVALFGLVLAFPGGGCYDGTKGHIIDYDETYGPFGGSDGHRGGHNSGFDGNRGGHNVGFDGHRGGHNDGFDGHRGGHNGEFDGHRGGHHDVVGSHSGIYKVGLDGTVRYVNLCKGY